MLEFRIARFRANIADIMGVPVRTHHIRAADVAKIVADRDSWTALARVKIYARRTFRGPQFQRITADRVLGDKAPTSHDLPRLH
jgi:hypothetical protein